MDAAKYFHIFGPVLAVGWALSVALTWPRLGIVAVGLQIIAINIYAYWIHRLMHSLPSHPLNYHIYSHHDKGLGLSRPVELIGEALCDLSWFAALLGVQWLAGVQWLDPVLVVFMGLWYTTVHVINMSCFTSAAHKTHHTEQGYNYGPAFYDAIFGTLKVDDDYHPHWDILNGVLIAGAIYFVQNRTLKVDVPKS